MSASKAARVAAPVANVTIIHIIRHMKKILTRSAVSRFEEFARLNGPRLSWLCMTGTKGYTYSAGYGCDLLASESSDDIEVVDRQSRDIIGSFCPFEDGTWGFYSRCA